MTQPQLNKTQITQKLRSRNFKYIIFNNNEEYCENKDYLLKSYLCNIPDLSL